MAHYLGHISPCPSPGENAEFPKPSPVRPHRGPTRSKSTFAQHTQASIARQTEKIELAQPRSHPSDDRRGSAAVSKGSQEISSAYDNGFLYRPLGRQASAISSRSGSSITPVQAANSYFPPQYGEDEELRPKNDLLSPLQEDGESAWDSEDLLGRKHTRHTKAHAHGKPSAYELIVRPPDNLDTSKMHVDERRARHEPMTMSEIEATVGELRRHIGTLNEYKTMSKLVPTIEELKDHIATLPDVVEDARKQCEGETLRLMAEVETLRSENKALKGELSDLREATTADQHQSQNKVESLQDETAGDPNQTGQGTTDFAEKIEVLTRERDAARAELSDSKEFQSQVKDLEKEITLRKNEDRRSKNAFQNQIKKFKENAREQGVLEREIDILQKQLSDAREQSEQSERTALSLAAEKQKLEKSIQNFQCKGVRLEEDCQRVKEIALTAEFNATMKINELTRNRDTARARTVSLKDAQAKSSSGQALAQLQRDFEELANVLREATTSRNIPRLEPLKALTQRTDISPEASTIQNHLLKLVNVLDERIETVSRQHTRTRDYLAKKHEQSPATFRQLQDERDNLEEILEEECKHRKQVERKLESCKKKAGEMYKPDFEKKYREVQANLTAALDEKARQKEQLDTYVQRARHWEGEYKISKVRAEKETTAFENIIKDQKDEMVMYIREYHDKIEDGKHWDLVSLQKNVSTLEDDKKQINKHFNAVKTEKAQLEDKLEELKKIIVELEKKNITVEELWARSVRTHQPSQNETTGEKSSEAHSSHPRTSRIPRYLHFTCLAEREASVQQLREQRKTRRQRKDTPEAVLESILGKLRIWHLDVGFDVPGIWKPAKYKGQSAWEMWQGDQWLNASEVSPEDQESVKMLREKGLIPPADKGEKEMVERKEEAAVEEEKDEVSKRFSRNKDMFEKAPMSKPTEY